MSSRLDRYLGGVTVVAPATLAVVLLAGCGDGGQAGSSAASTPATSTSATVASSSTKTTGAAAGTSRTGSAARADQTVTGSTNGPSSSSSQPVSSQVGGRLLRRFTGSGNTRLGTIVVSSAQVLVWRAQRPPVQIFAANRFILVSSHASTGSVRLSRGTYPGLRIASRAGWTIELRARS